MAHNIKEITADKTLANTPLFDFVDYETTSRT